jgi:hypothetical protein
MLAIHLSRVNLYSTLHSCNHMCIWWITLPAASEFKHYGLDTGHGLADARVCNVLQLITITEGMVSTLQEVCTETFTCLVV